MTHTHEAFQLHFRSVIDLKQYIDSLNPLSAESWDKVRALFAESKLKKGEFLIREGEVERHLTFLQTGIVRAFYRNSQGVEYNKHFFLAPCFMGGYASLITGQPNQINQQALTPCTVWQADFASFAALYDQCPDLERAARRQAELFFVYKEQREIEIVLLDAEKRYQLFQQQFPNLEQHVPQYHIASYLGITPTQLSRIRRKSAGR